MMTGFGCKKHSIPINLFRHGFSSAANFPRTSLEPQLEGGSTRPFTLQKMSFYWLIIIHVRDKHFQHTKIYKANQTLAALSVWSSRVFHVPGRPFVGVHKFVKSWILQPMIGMELMNSRFGQYKTKLIVKRVNIIDRHNTTHQYSILYPGSWRDA